MQKYIDLSTFSKRYGSGTEWYGTLFAVWEWYGAVREWYGSGSEAVRSGTGIVFFKGDVDAMRKARKMIGIVFFIVFL